MILAFTTVAHALSLGLSKLEVELEARPGGAYAEVLKVQNSSEEPIEVKIALSDWWFEGGAHRFQPVGTEDRSAAVWTEASKSALVLGAGETADVEIRGVVPPGTAPGGYYAAVFFQTVDSRNVGASMSMGTLVSVVVGAPPDPVVECEPASIATAADAVVTMPCQVVGVLHQRLTLKAVVRDASGSVVHRGASPEVRILPGQRRNLVLEVPALEPGTYQIDGLLTGGTRSTRVSSAFAVRGEDAGTP